MKAYDCWIDGEGSHTAQRVEVHDAMGDGPQRAAEQFVRWREADAHATRWQAATRRWMWLSGAWRGRRWCGTSR